MSQARAKQALAEAAAFENFLIRFELDEDPNSLTLYLAALESRDLPGQQIRRRLQLLDLERRLRGLTPWSADPDVRILLVGLHSHNPIGEGHSHFDPLYFELVLAMVDACRQRTPAQAMAHAGRLLRDQAGMTVAAMARIRWDDVYLTKHRLAITTTTKVGRGQATVTTISLASQPGEPRCPVTAMRALRSMHDSQHVFASADKPLGHDRLGRLLAEEAQRPTPAQVRDPALLLLGFGAALRTKEAQRLRQGDVQRHDHGLVLSIPGRRRLTYLPSHPDLNYDAASAWDLWVDRLRVTGFQDSSAPLFTATNFSVIFDKPMHEMGLNRMIHQRAAEAGLVGRFVWTSLRTGMMRTAVRDAKRSYSIAGHADLVSLGSVQRHERRENLLGKENVAGRLGL